MGGAIGALAAASTAPRLGGSTDTLSPLAPPHGFADKRFWLMLLVLPLASGIVAMVTARITALRQLWRMP